MSSPLPSSYLKSFPIKFLLTALLIFGFLFAADSVTFAQTTASPSNAENDTPGPEKFGIEKHGAIVYHTGDTYLLKCDVYQPIPKIESDQTMPAILMIHGGAWRMGSKFSMIRHARRMARVGYVVMVMNYRLAPKYPWPAQIEDCRVALDWLHEHASDYKIDTDRVGVYGFSAGAQMGSMLAATNEQNENIKIKAAAVGGTPAEFSWIKPDSNILTYWLGAPKEEAEDVYLGASTTTYVTSDDPPFFCFHGQSDWIIPVESGRALHATLLENNVESTLVELANTGHFGSFGNMDLMQDVIKFFNSHLKPLTEED